MSDAFRAVVSMSLSGSIVGLILFALKPVLKNRLSKQLQYYLWLIVIAQFLLPFSWELSLSKATPKQEAIYAMPQIVTVRDTVNRIVITDEEALEHVSYVAPQTNYDTTEFKKAQSPRSFVVSLFSTLIWPLGVILSLAWGIITYYLFVRRIKKALKESDINAKLPVFTSRLAQTPMLIGILKPVIILPEKQFNLTQLEFIISHELTHNKRKDILIKWLTTIAVSLHWFNPFVYLVRKEMNRACELSCDEAVIKALDGAGKQGYGDTLITVVSQSGYPGGIAQVTMCEDKKTLKERLVAIMKYKKQSKILLGVSVLLVTVIVSCAFVLSAKTGDPAYGNEPTSPAANDDVNPSVKAVEDKIERGLGDIEKIIDKNLDVIMSSPKTSSNPGDYINEHKAEYNEIIALGQAALPYLYKIYEADSSLRGAISLAAMLEIKPDLNINSAMSEGKYNNYRIETNGIDFDNPISGLYPAKEIRLIDTDTGKVLWSMDPGYLKTSFAWSPDGRYVAISYLARIYSETIVLDTKDMSLVTLPGINELAAKLDKQFAPRENRPDPYIWLYKWTYNQSPQLQLSFEWTAQDDKQVQGGVYYDVSTREILKLFAGFIPEQKPIDFGTIDKLEIKYNYFNTFEDGYKPFVTTDRNTIALITSMLSNSLITSELVYDDINRIPNPISTITLYSGASKQEIEYIIDTLYCKSVFTVDGVHYSPNYDTARLIQNIEELRPQNMEIDKSVKELLEEFGLIPAFKFSTEDVKLPDNLLYKGGEYPIKLYWSHNLQLSKDIGLDFTGYLGKTLKAEQYYLINPLPNEYKPQLDAFAVVLWDGDKIVGAYINAGRAGFACSLSQKSFENITGAPFESWLAENGYDMNDQTNINNAKLLPEEVVAKYYEALNKDDGSHFQYVSISQLKSRLYANGDKKKLYLSSWYEGGFEGIGSNVKSVKLLSMEPSKEPTGENERIYNIKIDLTVKQEITVGSGVDNLSIWLVKDGAAGWKVVGTGH